MGSVSGTLVGCPGCFFLIPAVLVLLSTGFLRRRRRRWPFKHLQRKGVYRTAPLPTGGTAFEERKRDFARVVAPSAKAGLYVVTASLGTPTPWCSSLERLKGNVNKEVSDAVFKEFSDWLQNELMSSNASEGLAKRVVALVSASEGFTFAMQQEVPPLFPQSKFVLVLSRTGVVRVLWLAFAAQEVMPNMTSTPFILKLLAQDVNDVESAVETMEDGVGMEYAVVHAFHKDLDKYILEKQSAGLSRAALENCWNDVLGSV